MSARRPHWTVALALLSLAFAAEARSQNVADFDAGHENRMGLTFSPDGRTAFWVEWDGAWAAPPDTESRIYFATFDGEQWSEPSPAPFSGAWSDSDPFVSPDGKWLYFVSDRPTGKGESGGDSDIWRYELAGKNRLERPGINSRAAEASPVVTDAGTLYFASSRTGGPGRGDLYRAAALADGFEPPEALGPAINSATGEWNLWVAPDETEIVFEASSRSTNVSRPGDLYYSWLTPSGWTPATGIASVNTRGSELMPRFDPAHATLYYTGASHGGHAQILTTDWQSVRAEVRASFAPVLAVANRASHEVVFVDLAGAGIVDRVATGDGPHLLSNVSEGRLAVTGYGLFPRPHDQPVAARPPFIESLNSRLTVIDVDSREPVLDTVVDDCARPHHSRIVGRYVYVTCEDERAIRIVDIETGRTEGHLDTEQDGTHVLSFDESTRVLAASNTDDGSVTLFDLDDGTSRVLPLAPGSEGALALDGRLWVANALDGSVSLVDLETMARDKHMDSVCGFPISLASGHDGLVWIACFASSELIAIDADDFAIERRIGLEHRPLHVIGHPERPLAYVSLPRRNAVAEIDLESGEELRRIRVGIEPDGLAWISGSE